MNKLLLLSFTLLLFTACSNPKMEVEIEKTEQIQVEKPKSKSQFDRLEEMGRAAHKNWPRQVKYKCTNNSNRDQMFSVNIEVSCADGNKYTCFGVEKVAANSHANGSASVQTEGKTIIDAKVTSIRGGRKIDCEITDWTKEGTETVQEKAGYKIYYGVNNLTKKDAKAKILFEIECEDGTHFSHYDVVEVPARKKIYANTIVNTDGKKVKTAKAVDIQSEAL